MKSCRPGRLPVAGCRLPGSLSTRCLGEIQQAQQHKNRLAGRLAEVGVSAFHISTRPCRDEIAGWPAAGSQLVLTLRPQMEAARLLPRVGVGVLVLNKSRTSVLVGRRRSSVGDSTFALPGGRLEFGETWEECAAREVLEETGLVIDNIQFAGVNNTVMLKERRPCHLVSIFMRGELLDPTQEPKNLEPDKCYGWQWAQWPYIPKPVFEPLQTFLKSGYKL